MRNLLIASLLLLGACSTTVEKLGPGGCPVRCCELKDGTMPCTTNCCSPDHCPCPHAPKPS